MQKAEDTSGIHFDWLVASRSRNQLSTLKLYRIIEEQDRILSRNVLFQTRAQDLAAIAFSLWRAVFLSDLKGEVGGQLADVRRFLQSLIAHNAILYQTDFNTRDWTFKYYLENAIFRLKLVSDGSRQPIATLNHVDVAETYAKDDWTFAQDALEATITNFEETLAAYGSK